MATDSPIARKNLLQLMSEGVSELRKNIKSFIPDSVQQRSPITHFLYDVDEGALVSTDYLPALLWRVSTGGSYSLQYG